MRDDSEKEAVDLEAAVVLDDPGFPTSFMQHPPRVRPDVGIIDIGLPGMDGYQAATGLARTRSAAATWCCWP